MSLYSYYSKTNVFYIVSILNTRLMYNYLKTFINNSAALQINDFRLFPIIIPTENQLQESKIIFDKCIEIQKQKFKNAITEEEAKKELCKEQIKLEEIVSKIYRI